MAITVCMKQIVIESQTHLKEKERKEKGGKKKSLLFSCFPLPLLMV